MDSGQWTTVRRLAGSSKTGRSSRRTNRRTDRRMDMFDMLSTRIVEHATPGNIDSSNVATTTMWSWQKYATLLVAEWQSGTR